MKTCSGAGGEGLDGDKNTANFRWSLSFSPLVFRQIADGGKGRRRRGDEGGNGSRAPLPQLAMTKRSESLQKRPLEQAEDGTVPGSLPGLAHSAAAANGCARSRPLGEPSAALSPGSDQQTPAVPVRLVWQDPVTGEELTLQLEACPELIEGLKQEGFEDAAPQGADDDFAAA